MDGTCKDCGDYEKSQNDGKTCGPDKCKDREKILIYGTCELCPYFEKVIDDLGRVCGPEKCTVREKLTKFGECEKCEDYTKVSKDGRSC